MRVFALSDPHLSLGTPGKEMDRFGPQWVGHAAKMAAAWDERVQPGDVVLVPGDISWAKGLEAARPDLQWLAERPGTKVLGKGNHEYWWPDSRAKLAAALPEGCRPLHADALRIGDLAIAGTRLWDVPDVSYHDWIQWQGEPISPERSEADQQASLKVYHRELRRLDRALEALQALPAGVALRIAAVHYPPVAPGLSPNELTDRFERARIDHVVFGHLHTLDPSRHDEIGGQARGVTYHLASCDFLDFAPLLICEV